MRTPHALLVALGVVACGVLTGCGGCKNEIDPGPPDAATIDAVGCGGNTPCRADQACRYDTCVPTPPACAMGVCPGDTYCDTSTNECLPWGVGPGGDHDDECIREVVPGVFFPGVQCEWLGPPAGDPFPDHKNVLGGPMVATFSGTGGGEFGSPSIVFISYNFTDGGAQSCAGTDPMYFGVLRVIDGRTCEQLASFPDKIIASQSVAIADLGGWQSVEFTLLFVAEFFGRQGLFETGSGSIIFDFSPGLLCIGSY